MRKDVKTIFAVLLLAMATSSSAGSIVDEPGSGLPSGDIFSGSGSASMIVIEIEGTDPVTEMDSNSTVELCAKLQEPMVDEGVEVTLLVSTENGTADSDSDFVPLENVPLTLSSMNRRNCVNVTIIGDGLIENNETFYAVFEVGDSTTLPVMILPVSCRIPVSILDDDGAILLLEILSDTLLESGTPATVCVMLSDDMDGLSREVVVTAEVIPVTADPDDFVVDEDRLMLVFRPGAPCEICFNISATDGMLVEEDETLMVRIMATNSLDVIMQNMPNNSVMEVDGLSVATAVLTIEDNDGIVVELDSSTAVVVVEGVQVMICVTVVTVGEGLRRNATFFLSEDNGTASAEDYMIQSNLSIPSGSISGSQHCFYILVVEDNMTEDEESAVFSLNALNSNDAVMEPSTFSFIIRDFLNDSSSTLSPSLPFPPTQSLTPTPAPSALSSDASSSMSMTATAGEVLPTTSQVQTQTPSPTETEIAVSTSEFLLVPSSDVQTVTSIPSISSFSEILPTSSIPLTITVTSLVVLSLSSIVVASSSLVLTTPISSEVSSTTSLALQPETLTPSPTIAVSTSEFLLLPSSDVLPTPSIPSSSLISSSVLSIDLTSSIPFSISAMEPSFLLSSPSLTSSVDISLTSSMSFLPSPAVSVTVDLLTSSPEVSSSMASLESTPTQSSTASSLIDSVPTTTAVSVPTPSVSIPSVSSATMMTSVMSAVATPPLSTIFSVSSSFISSSSEFLSSSISPTPSFSLQAISVTSSPLAQPETPSSLVVEQTPALTFSAPMTPTPSPSLVLLSATESTPLPSSQEISVGTTSTMSSVILTVEPSPTQTSIAATSELTVSTQLSPVSSSVEVTLLLSSSLLETTSSSIVVSIETTPISFQDTVTSTANLVIQTPSITSTSTPSAEAITSIQQLVTTALMATTSALVEPSTTSIALIVETVVPTSELQPTPQPTPPPVPEVIAENSVVVELQGFTVETFTEELQEEFRRITAFIINEFCADNPGVCRGIQVIFKRQADVTVEPDDIIITNIMDTDNGVEFDMYVNLDDGMSGMQGMQVLPLAAIEVAVEMGMEEYTIANFTVLEVAPLIAPPSPSPSPSASPSVEVDDDDGLTDGQLAGIVVASAVGFALLLGLLFLIVFCCIQILSKKRRSKYMFTTTPGTSYGMTYRGEPIMEFTLMNENTQEDNESVQSVRLTFQEKYDDSGSSDGGQEDTKSQDKVTHF